MGTSALNAQYKFGPRSAKFRFPSWGIDERYTI